MMNRQLLLLEQLQILSREVHSGHWKKFIDEQVAAFNKNYATAPVAVRRQTLLALRGMYGGMGTLNDELVDPSARNFLEQLIDTVDEELRENWKQLGNPTATPKQKLLFVGQRVELIEGEIWVTQYDGTEKRVPDQSHLKNRMWIVSSVGGTDITGMPVYVLAKPDSKGGTVIKSARHNAIRPV